MAYEFQAVDISAFDYHEMLAPLTAPGLTKPDFNFLTDEALYNNAYKVAQAVQSAHFIVQPLRWRALNYHHFWRHYQTIWYAGGQPDFWKLQMPFVCKPTHAQVEVVTGSQDFAGRARSHVFLSALGWSNGLDISLRGKMTPDQLRDFVGNLRDQKSPPFRVSGQGANGQQMQHQSMTLPQVFQLLSDQLRRDVYASDLVDTVRVKRYLVITLSQFSGEDIRYYRSQQVGVKQMPEASRQVMHSILGGKPVSVGDLLAMEGKQPGYRNFLLTRFNEADFAITYFDYGTLIFMQQTSFPGSQPSRVKAMRCHSANIRNYLAMTHALSWFYRDTAGSADAKVADLRAHVRGDLEQTSSKFISPFSVTFRDNYGPLQKL